MLADIDECAENNGGCGAHRSCTNSAGDHSCSACFSGFLGNSQQGCDGTSSDRWFLTFESDVDECKNANGGCDPLTLCENTVGSRKCKKCPSGYSGTGETGCHGSNECL